MFLLQDLLGLAGYHSYNITWWFNFMIIIFYLLFPIISWAAQKSGFYTLIGSMVFMGLFKMDYNINVYLFAFVLGILWHKLEADKDIRERIKATGRWPVLIGILAIGLTIVIRLLSVTPEWSEVKMDVLVFFSIVFTIGVVFLLIFVLRKFIFLISTFSFLGKHATNIYLMHTFVNAYWHFDWLHEGIFMRIGGNFIVLLAICLATSLLLEQFKNKIRFYKLLNHIKMKLS